MLTEYRIAAVWDFIERAGWTAGQQFVAVLLAGSGVGTVVGLPWKYATAGALGAAVVSLITTAIQYLTKQTDLKFWPDTIVRLIKTALASILASIGTDYFDVFEFDWASALNVAALATLGVLAKSLLAGSGGEQRPDANGQGQLSPKRNPSTLPVAEYKLATSTDG